MKVDIDSGYYFNMEKFGDLFSGTIKTETLNALKTSAAAGELSSIELLNNLALRQDEHGKQAEKILFDLFCGKTPTDKNSGVIQRIQESALMLYELSVNDKMKNNTDMHKLRTPSKLLYIAGSTASTGDRLSLSRLFTQGQHTYSAYEQFDDADLWNPARMLPTDEMNMAIKLHARRNNAPDINFPVGLINPHNHENILSLQINEQLSLPTFLDSPEFFPVNTGEHWITFGLYKPSPDAQPRAVVCNTFDDLSPEVKQHLIDAANIAGVTDPDHMVFLENNIQEFVPNGCGLLTVEAIKLLIENNFQEPVETLQTFLSSFTQLSIAEQEQFNLQNRYRIYAETCLQ